MRQDSLDDVPDLHSNNNNINNSSNNNNEDVGLRVILYIHILVFNQLIYLLGTTF